MSDDVPMYFILDRNREVIRDGAEYMTNLYQCSSCGVIVMNQCMLINFCNTCGVKFEDFEDRSM